MCGKRDIKLDYIFSSSTLDIHVPYNQSCFYRVETSCGWPGAIMNVSNFDVAAVSVDMSMEEGKLKFPTVSYPFRANETFTSNTLIDLNHKNFNYTFTGVRDNTENTCGVRRVMLFTVSNFNNPPPAEERVF
jgi:hypothetical protein